VNRAHLWLKPCFLFPTNCFHAESLRGPTLKASSVTGSAEIALAICLYSEAGTTPALFFPGNSEEV
jgi:hypothetical protein